MTIPFVAIFAAGFASATSQILLLRELIVLFQGNELSTGLILAVWLVWTALGSVVGAGLGGRAPSPRVLGAVLALQGMLAPVSILFIRGSRILWSIPPGEMFPFGIMLAVTALSTMLLCTSGGLLFALGWGLAFNTSAAERGRPLRIYVGEAVGSAAGGLWAHYLVLPRWDGIDAAFLIAGILVGGGAWLLKGQGESGKRSWGFLGAGALGVSLVTLAVPFVSSLSFSSHRWQWGDQLVAVRNTPFQQLALLMDGDQISLFGNGLWYFSIPDPQTAEMATHLGLLQHPEPTRVLLVGGGAGGLLQEVLKHPSIQRIDHVELDPEVLRLVRAHAPSSLEEALDDERVRTHLVDGGTFIRHVTEPYDVILLNVGEPANAALNRFYTIEFYQRLRTIMNPGAVLSFGLSAAPDILGDAQVRVLGVLRATLSEAFAEVLVIPGESVRFLASSTTGVLSEDPLVISGRKSERRLDVQYLQEHFLADLMSPLRLDTLRSLLDAGGLPRINRDYSPVCYFHGLVLWASQLHPLAERFLAMAGRHVGQLSPSYAAAATLILALVLVWCRAKEGRAILVSAAVTGASLLTLEIVLLMAFQILEGLLYTELAIIISSTMVGMAVGAGIVEPFVKSGRKMNRWLIAVQWLLALFFTAVILGLVAVHGDHAGAPASLRLHSMLFRGLALMGGILGGLHFSLASAVWAGKARLEARIGARVYGADLMGAALGALLSTLLLLPLHGLLLTLGFFGGLLAFAGLLLLVRPGWS